MDLPEKPYVYQMLIDGNWCDTENGKQYKRKSPAHDVVVGRYPDADEVDAEKAIISARNAFDKGPWPRTSSSERAKIISKVAELIRTNADELALIETIESGKPIKQARFEMDWAAGLWDYAATLPYHTYGDTYNSLGEDMLGMVLREPIGVVSIITPWNFPLLIISQKLPFALAVGCTTVCKPSKITSGTTLYLGKILQQAGMPKGVVNIITGSGSKIGNYMANHPMIDMVSLTGSTEVGKQVLSASKSNIKKAELELGGKNPQLVFADADLEAALDAVVFGVYFNQGECCNSGSRLLIQENIAKEFTNKVIERTKTIPVGDPLKDDTKIGAIVSEEQFDVIMNYIKSGKKQGAILRLGGNRIKTEHGRYIEPTIFDDVTPEMEIAKEEIFGPVLSIIKFKTLEDAVRIANSTAYGLSASVWTKDIDTALTVSRKIKAGTIWVNTFMNGYPELCFGGYKESGLGRELGRFAIDEFSELKTVQLHIGPRTNWWHVPK